MFTAPASHLRPELGVEGQEPVKHLQSFPLWPGSMHRNLVNEAWELGPLAEPANHSKRMHGNAGGGQEERSTDRLKSTRQSVRLFTLRDEKAYSGH